MGYHHLALAVKNMQHTHEFYEQAMGFRLTHVERATTSDGGFANHYFYDTGDDAMMAFWELQDPAIGEYPTGLSEAAGLPDWVNHLAFLSHGHEHTQEIIQRWLSLGLNVLEMDHHWCHSIYQMDPDGNFVEFCYTVSDHDDAMRERALRALGGETLEPDQPPIVKVHQADKPCQLSFNLRPFRGTMAEVAAARKAQAQNGAQTQG